MASGATKTRIEIVGRRCPLLVEQRLADFNQTVDLGCIKPSTTRKFQEPQVGRIFEPTIIAAPKEVAERDLECLGNPDQRLVTGASFSALQQGCEADGDSAFGGEGFLGQALTPPPDPNSPGQLFQGILHLTLSLEDKLGRLAYFPAVLSAHYFRVIPRIHWYPIDLIELIIGNEIPSTMEKLEP